MVFMFSDHWRSAAVRLRRVFLSVGRLVFVLIQIWGFGVLVRNSVLVYRKKPPPDSE